MKQIIILSLILFSLKTFAQDNLADNGIYLTADDYRFHHLTCSFHKADKYHWKKTWSHEIWIKTKDTTYKYAYSCIWGYRMRGKDWRVFDSASYRVIYTGKSFVYLRMASSNYDAANVKINDTQQNYFSVSLTSPVLYLNTKNLLKAYAANKAFIQKISSSKISPTKWDKLHHCYLYITYLNSF